VLPRMVMPTLGPRTTSHAILHWAPSSLPTALFFIYCYLLLCFLFNCLSALVTYASCKTLYYDKTKHTHTLSLSQSSLMQTILLQDREGGEYCVSCRELTSDTDKDDPG